MVKYGSNETRSGYMQYVKGIQMIVVALTLFIDIYYLFGT